MAELTFWGCLPFLTAAFFTDIRAMRIPNGLSVSAVVAGLVVQGIAGGWQGLIFAGIGAATGFMLMLFLYALGAVGAGDVKFFAGIGAWTGMRFTVQVIVYSILFAALIGWVIVIRRRETGSRLRQIFNRITRVLVFHSPGLLKSGEEKMLKFPFMLAVIPASICAYIYF